MGLSFGLVRGCKMKRTFIWPIFWVLLAVFGVSILMMFLPFLSVHISPMVLWPALLILGVMLFVLTLKTQMNRNLKRFLLITGVSPIGFIVFVLLHNLVSGLFNTEEPVFFVLATMVCPLGFIAGIIGSIILKLKQRQAN